MAFARREFGTARGRPLLLGVAAIALLASAPAAMAGDFTWTGGAGDLLWNTPGNWEPGSTPTSDDAATIAAQTTLANKILANGADSAASLKIGGLGGKDTTSLSIAGSNTLTLSGALDILSGGQVAVTYVNTGTVPNGIGLSTNTIDVEQGGELDVAYSTVYAAAGVTLSGDKTTKMQGAGILVTDGAFVQSGGKQGIDLVIAPSYDLSGGQTSDGEIDFSTDFKLSGTGNVPGSNTVLVGGLGSTMEQSGGTMNGTVSGITSYTQSGGSLGGIVNTGIYDLTDASATSSGATINASDQFTLEPESGTATVDAYLTGTGKLVKSGGSTVVLTNSSNDFTGAVAINAGTLQVLDSALPDDSAVTVGDGATLQMTSNNDTVFIGSMDGDAGSLVKDGAGMLTLGGNVTLGGLSVDAGTLAIGDGTATNSASFDSATIAQDATLYIASGATLTIRVPNNIVNNGHLINDGTVYDDLANANVFDNNLAYNANVASNTGTINNNTPGVWTGNVITNAGTINNNAGAQWKGNIEANSGTIVNNQGGTWTGTVASTGYVRNHGTWNGDIESNFFKDIYNDGAGVTWTGDVVTNDSQIVNDNGATWNGKILGNNNVVFNMAGSFWNGDVVANGGGSNGLAQIDNRGTWTGAVDANAGAIFNTSESWNGDILANTGLVVNNDNDLNLNPTGANHAVWTGDVVTNDSQIINDHGGVWSGKVEGNNNVIFNESGATWTGAVTGNGGGSNVHAQIDNYGTWDGDIEGNAGAVDNFGLWEGNVQSGNTGTVANVGATWTGVVAGNTGRVVNVGGAWNGDVAANAGAIKNETGGTWTGAVETNSGSIDNQAGGIWAGDVLGNAGTIDNEGIWNGSFTNAGTVNAQGSINGDFTNSGLLHLTGSLSGLGALSNTGTIDMGSGTTQTLGAASASFGPGSFYKVNLDASGASDEIVVAGAAALDGTVDVRGMSTGGTFDDSTRYTILTAGSLGGTSFNNVSTDLAFLAPRLSYDASDVYLTLMRNDVGFADVGVSANQQAAAAGAESLGAGNPIYDAVLWLNGDQAQRAFDELSGEAYSSMESGFVENAGLLADVLSGRLDQAFDALGDGDAATSSYADGPAVPAHPTKDRAIWGQVYGARGSLAASGNAAGLDASTGGVAGGIDGMLGDWRVGLMMQAGATGAAASALDTTMNSADYGLGAYGGRQWGGTRLSLGATYTRHDVSSSRSVAFPGFTDDLTASYAAGTTQAFGKLSHDFDLGAMSLIPYASLGYVRQDTDAFVESGGPAALSSAASTVDATFTTLGVGADRKFVVGDGMLLTAKGAIGWRHAFAGTPSVTRTLAGGTSFSVVGTPIVADTVVLSAGLNLDVNADNSFDLSYDGEIGDGTQTHAVKGTWGTRF